MRRRAATGCRHRKGPALVDVRPFHGLRFAPGDRRDLAVVTAPPYDAIDARLAEQLRERSPYNVVRLELAAGGTGSDRYRTAATTFRRWRRAGVLQRDHEPTVTVYEQAYDRSGGRGTVVQRGVLAALEVVPWEEGAVLPHENVFPGPVEDRLRLLETLPVNLSPVFVVAERPLATLDTSLQAVAETAPLATFTDRAEGTRHRVWVCADHEVHEVVSRAFAGVRVLMADGHHRYTTALRYRSRHRKPGASHVLAFVVAPPSADGSGGPSVRPMHRLVTGWPHDAPERLARGGFIVRPQAPSTPGAGTHGTPADRGAGNTDHGDADERAFRVVTRSESHLVRWEGDRPPGPTDVAVAVADRALRDVLGVDLERSVSYEPDGERALEAVATGRADSVLLVPPVSLDTVWDGARAGERMPPKSTSFFPKPRTGIVMRPIDDTTGR